MTAYETKKGRVCRICNRSGNMHDDQARVAILGEWFEQLRVAPGCRPMLEMGMCGP